MWMIRLSVIALAFLVLGCRTVSIYNPQNVTFSTEPRPLDVITDTIKLTGQGLGWQMSEVRKGEISGTYSRKGKHIADVSITFDSHQFNIDYADSYNLKYDSHNQAIHKVYNHWVKNLENAIRASLKAPIVTETWHGRLAEALMANWGPPSRDKTLSDGRRVLAYIYDESYGFIGGGQGILLGGIGTSAGGVFGYKAPIKGEYGQSTCTIVFRVNEDGQVVGSRFGGGGRACKKVLNTKPSAL